MSEHVKRMEVERVELCEKISKLREFIRHNPIFSTLDMEDADLMSDQLNAMCVYETFLSRRIQRSTR